MNRWRCYVIVRMSCAHRLSSAAALSLEVEAMTQTRSSRVLRVRWIAWWRAMGNSVVINHSKPTRRHQGPRQAQIGSRRVERPSRKSFFTWPPRQNRRGRGSRCQGDGSGRGISQLAVAGTLVLRRDPAPLEPEPRRRGLHYTCACSEVTYLRCLWQSAACSLGLSATSQQYFSLTPNQPPATSQQYFSLRTNQHQPSATSQTNRLLAHLPWPDAPGYGGQGPGTASRRAVTPHRKRSDGSRRPTRPGARIAGGWSQDSIEFR
jgi:hypothetical protein